MRHWPTVSHLTYCAPPVLYVNAHKAYGSVVIRILSNCHKIWVEKIEMISMEMALCVFKSQYLLKSDGTNEYECATQSNKYAAHKTETCAIASSLCIRSLWAIREVFLLPFPRALEARAPSKLNEKDICNGRSQWDMLCVVSYLIAPCIQLALWQRPFRRSKTHHTTKN